MNSKEVLLNEIIEKFEESELLREYKRTLKAVKENKMARTILNNYRDIAKFIKEKRNEKVEVESDDFERYSQAVKKFEGNEIIKEFLVYDSQVAELIENLDLELRKKIQEAFKSTYIEKLEGPV